MAKAEIRGYQRGDVLDYINETDEMIPALTILPIGAHIGIAAGDIQPGELGAVYVEGVFNLPKADGEAIDAWADVVWTGDGCTAGTAAVSLQADGQEPEGQEPDGGGDTGSGTGTDTEAASAPAGMAVAAAASDDEYVKVRLSL